MPVILTRRDTIGVAAIASTVLNDSAIPGASIKDALEFLDGDKVSYNFENNTISGTGDIYAGSYFGDGSNLTGIDHGTVSGLGDDDHSQYSLADGTRSFTGTVGGITPVVGTDLTTKLYVDTEITTATGALTTDHGSLTGLTDNDHAQYVTGVSGSTPLRGGGQTLGFDETVIDHDALTNFTQTEHRIINDSGTSSTELWSASQIESRVVTATGSLTTDHASLTGLSADDHPQYFLADSSRAFSGDLLPNVSGSLDIGSLALPFRSIYLTGSSLYMDGNKILFTDGPDIVLASPDGSIVISGSINLSDGILNHDELTGLADDDHTQYHNDTRGDARYYTETELDAGQLDNRYHTESEITTISGDIQTNIDTNTTAIGLNTTHRGSDGSDHSIVGSNTTAIGLNTTHRSSDGSDHSIVGSNTSAITANTTLITTTSGDLQTNIDALTHDGFADFVTNEHLDWSADLGATNMHDNNIVASNVTQHQGSIDHGSISGLADDDHAQYLLADGTRHAATLVVDGDLIVSGTRFIANTETVLIEDNLLVINNGEVGAGVTLGEAGIEVDRGSEVNYRFMFDETDDVFVVGVSGSEQAVATRLDSASMTASGIPYWDDGNIRFPTTAGFIFTGGNARVPASTPLNDADLTRKDYVDSAITTATGSLTSNHGSLTGLSADDHTQYILVDGSRAFTGNILPNASGTLDLGSASMPFNNLYLDGTSLYMGAAEVIYLVANGLVLKSPNGNPITLTTNGGAALITDSSGGIKLNTGSQYVNEFSTDTTLSGNSDTAIPTEKAVKTYVDTETNAVIIETDIKVENESANCNGSTTAFTLDYTPVVNSIQVFLNGLLQEMGSGKDYTHSGTNITFAVAPLTGDILIIHYIVNN